MKVEDLFSVKGKVALVTGGSRGLGLIIARAYVENGAKVYVTSRSQEACDQAAAELSAIGECVALPADLSKSEDRARLIAELSAREDALHILVNNAGASWGVEFDDYPEDGFDKVMDLNVKAIFFLTRDLMPLLEAAASDLDPARVINVGSIDGLWVPELNNYAYSASKAAVHHMSRVLAVKLKGRGVTINAIAPGFFATKLTKWVMDNYQEHYEDNCPLGRIGTPPDMAGVAIYLASRAGAYVNGAVITVDGGLSLS